MMKVNAKRFYILIICLVIASFTANSQISNDNRVGENLIGYTNAVAQQKLYLHLDKDQYFADETIWFKAYLIRGTDHYPDTTSQNLYVEMINNRGNVVDVKILLLEDGVASGYIYLDLDIPDGNYTLRAYTDWMRNFNDEFYYTRHLYISNPSYEDVIPRADVRFNRRFNRNLERSGSNYSVAFFPEGGNLVENTLNRIAFRVADELGNGQSATGEIVDGSGNIITEFETAFSGNGKFDFTPQSGKSYRARISVNNQRNRFYDLPAIEKGSIAIIVEREPDLIILNIASTSEPGDPLYSENITVIGHTRGIPHFIETYQIEDGNVEVFVDEESFPRGIAHFTVFTDRSVAVAERLIYIKRDSEVVFSPTIGRRTIVNEDHYILNFQVAGNDGLPIEGNFSFSAVTGKPGEEVFGDDLLTYFLLNSDLTGEIEDPGFNFNTDIDTSAYIDHLMLINGWRRFRWEDVLSETLPDLPHEITRGLRISGSLIDPSSNERLNNYPIEMVVRGTERDTFSMTTGEYGRFYFSDLYYEGEAAVEIRSRRLPANYPPTIELNMRGGGDSQYNPGIFTREQSVTDRGDNWTRVSKSLVSTRDFSTARNTSPQIYGAPDQTIFIDTRNTTETTLYEVLRKHATGMTFQGGRIIIRGGSSIGSYDEPSFMIDGVFVDNRSFLGNNPADFQRIEIFKGPRAAIFGMRGGAGVILAYSRVPGYSGFVDVMEFSMYGYQAEREFFRSRMGNAGGSAAGSDTRTLLWEPEIQSGENGRISLAVPVPDRQVQLTITLEGVGVNGELGSYRMMFFPEE